MYSSPRASSPNDERPSTVNGSSRAWVPPPAATLRTRLAQLSLKK